MLGRKRVEKVWGAEKRKVYAGDRGVIQEMSRKQNVEGLVVDIERREGWSRMTPRVEGLGRGWSPS